MIHEFQSSYFDFDRELQEIMSVFGIKYVRVPVSWCWMDHDPSKLVTKNDNDDSLVYRKDEEVMEMYASKDTFCDGVHWPASKL